MMLWLFLLGIISMNLWSRAGRLEQVDFANLYPQKLSTTNPVQNKKLMILGDRLSLYRDNSLGGFFLNWELSAPVFNNLSTYRNVEIIASCFERDPPEVIYDDNSLMKKVFKYIPSIETEYEKEGNTYRRISN